MTGPADNSRNSVLRCASVISTQHTIPADPANLSQASSCALAEDMDVESEESEQIQSARPIMKDMRDVSRQGGESGTDRPTIET